MMVDKAREEELRKQITSDIVLYLQTKGDEIQSSDLSPVEQLIQVDMILDVIKFLDKYKENVQVLNRHYLGKSKFER